MKLLFCVFSSLALGTDGVEFKLGPLMQTAVEASGQQAAVCLLAMGLEATNASSISVKSLGEGAREVFDTSDQCELLPNVLASWTACGELMEQAVELAPWWFCRTVENCRRSNSLDAFHGICLAQCQNEEISANKTIATTCDQPLLVGMGLTHAKICGDSIPADVLFQYQGTWDIVLLGYATLGIQFVSSFMESWDTLESSYILLSLNVVDVLGWLFNLAVVVHVFIFVVHHLHDVSDACRFAVLATPLQFAPLQLSFCQLGVLSVRVYTGLMQAKHKDLTPEDICKVGRNWQTLLTLGPFAFVVASVLVFLLPLFLATFWSLFAYVHILLILLILPVPCVGAILTWGAIMSLDANTVSPLPFVTFLITLATFITAVLSLTCCAGFIMFFTGDWLPFHSEFFIGWTLPPFAMPNLGIMLDWGVLSEILKEFFTFNMDMRIGDLFFLSISVTFVVLPVLRMIRTCCDCCCFLCREVKRQAKGKFQTVIYLKPGSKRLNLVVKIIDEPSAVEGGKRFEVKCGDASGQIILALTEAQKEFAQKGNVVIVRNGFIAMAHGHMRLCLDFKSGKLDTTTVETVETVGETDVSAHQWYDPEERKQKTAAGKAAAKAASKAASTHGTGSEASAVVDCEGQFMPVVVGRVHEFAYSNHAKYFSK